jgi:hypothetical protein
MDDSNALEALRLISDWAKWLITIETGAIATIGAMVKGGDVPSAQQRGLATAAVLCFVASICSAAVLLLSLPEVAQNLRPGISIWMTSDSVLNGVFGLDTQTLATFESLFFAAGIICFAAFMLSLLWSPASGRTRRAAADG